MRGPRDPIRAPVPGAGEGGALTGTASFEIAFSGPYSLEASRRFLEGFAPAARSAENAEPDGHLHLAWVVVEEGGEAAGACLRQTGERVRGEVYGRLRASIVRGEVARILSLDVDGSGFAAVGARDPVVARLQTRHPGLRPVNFHSPYEAAAWALIGHRIQIRQAARVKERMARELGDAIDIHGDVRWAFPAPARLAELTAFPGLFGRKPEYLRRLGEAASAGALDPVLLRELPTDEALARLRELPGVGPFSSELILLRGAGAPDHLPLAEPRLRRAVALAYGLDAPPETEQLEAIADVWRPYRTWVTLLLRTMLEEETGEIRRDRPTPTSA